jgi:hypothetical protein
VIIWMRRINRVNVETLEDVKYIETGNVKSHSVIVTTRPFSVDFLKNLNSARTPPRTYSSKLIKPTYTRRKKYAPFPRVDCQQTLHERNDSAGNIIRFKGEDIFQPTRLVHESIILIRQSLCPTQPITVEILIAQRRIPDQTVWEISDHPLN